MTDECLGVFVGVVFGLGHVFAVLDKDFHVERGIQRTVADADGLHGFAAHRFVVKELPMPSEHRIALQLQVGHHVGEGVGLVLAAAAHLVLSLLQQFQHCGVRGELGIDG